MEPSDIQLLEVVPAKYGFKMLVTPEVYSNYNNGPYERFSIELLESHLRDGSLFIDIGAHYGYYSLVAGTRYLNNRVIAFEPSPQNYEILKKNIERNGLNNVKLYNMAVSDRDGVGDFIIAEHSDNCGFYDHPLTRSLEKVQIRTTALDSLVKDVPEQHAIVKIDVEGHEISVLKGMSNLLRKIEDAELFIEFNPKMISRSGHEPADLLNLIDSMGFDIFFIEDQKREAYKMRDPKGWSGYFKDRQQDYFNLLCIRKEQSLSICIFSHSSQLEGAERGLLELTTELIRNHGVLCTVVLPGEGPLKEKLESVGASTLAAGYEWWCDWKLPDDDKICLSVNNSFSALCGLMGKLETIGPDIILSNTIVIPWGAVAALMMDKPHVWYAREFGERDHGLKFFKPFGEVIRIVGTSNLVITNSNAVKQELFKDVTGNIATIYNHISIPPDALALEDKGQFFTREGATKLIITGRIDEPKGQEDAVLAIKELVGRGKNVELIIMGTRNPAYLEKLKTIISENSIEPYVRFMDFNPNPYPVVNEADIVVLCSRNEAFGRVIVEAMLLKKPVVGANSGGVPEIIKEGYNGLLYDPEDSVGLADRIEYLINNRDKIAETGENGYRFALENFSEEKYGGEVYRRLTCLKGIENNAPPSLYNYAARLMSRVLVAKQSELDRVSGQKEELEAAARARDLEIRQKEDSVRELVSQNSSMSGELSSIKGSLTWRTLMSYQSLIQRLMPHGTRRRVMYDRALKGTRIIVNAGPVALVSSFREYLRTRKKGVMAGSVGPAPEEKRHNTEEEHPRDAGGDKKYIADLFERARDKSAEKIQISRDIMELEEDDVRLIAFYLPQFHPIPENNMWWGKGFTEWTNVSKAVPQFVGHYQPRLPGELGFYDLRLADIQRRQVELAKQYGIRGFCFHYYWFNGKRLLEKPLDQYVEHKELDLPFCICWANENWTKRWDGEDQEILIAQVHTKTSDDAFIKDLEPYLRDPRYIRINGKPLIIVYRVKLLPDAKETAMIWREYCAAAGIGEIYLAAVQGFGFEDPREYGFDAAVEFPPNTITCNNITHEFTIINPEYEGNIFDYKEFVRSKRYIRQVPYKLFKNVMPGWDNTARRLNNATIFWGSEPDIYKEWLCNAMDFTRKAYQGDERIVFINAWNEWAESAYLEPDRKYGYAYLQATADAIRESGKKSIGAEKIIFVSHDAHYHGAQLLALHVVKVLSEQFHCEVYVLLKSGGVLEKELKKYARVYDLEKDYRSNKALEKLVDDLRREGVETAICNTVVSGDVLKILSDRGIRTIALIHEMPELIHIYKMEGNAGTIVRSSDKVVFASAFVRDKFRAIAPVDDKKCVILPQGLYLNNKYKGMRQEARAQLCRKYSIPPSANIVLAVGFADFRKGVDLFMAVAKKAIDAGQDTYFFWVGHQEDTFMKDILAEAKKPALNGRVIFTGLQEDTGLFYSGSDVYLLTSREDPFPSTVLEAMDAGTPVIGFEGAGGFSDIVTAWTGILVPFLDIEGMSKELTGLLKDKDMREKLGNNSSKLIDQKYRFTDYVYSLLGLLGHEYPKVSVIVPNYNYGRYLKARLQSITAQEYPVYEIIILDDCSTDNSAEIIKDFADNSIIPVKVIFNEKNSGSVFRQWSKGIENAGGEYIWIAEADDLCDKEFLREAMKGLYDEQVVLSYTQSKQIDRRGRITANDYLDYTKNVDGDKWKADYSRDGTLEIRDTLAIKNTIPNVSGVVFRKYDISGIVDELSSFKVAGDWYFYVWLLQKGRISYSARSLNLHRRHNDGVTLSENAQEHLNEIVRMQDYVMEHFDIDDAAREKVLDYREWVTEYLLGKQAAELRQKPQKGMV